MTRRTFKTAALAVVAIAAFFIFLPATCRGDYGRFGREAYADGNWTDAAAYLRIAHEQSPADADVTHLLAKSLVKLDDRDGARALWSTLIALPDWRDRAAAGIANSAAEEGDVALALRELDRAGGASPSVKIIETRGRVHLRQAEDALESFKKYLSKHLRKSSVDRIPVAMYEFRALKEEDYETRVKRILDRLQSEEGFEDFEAFRAAFAPVRDAAAKMEAAYAKAAASAPDAVDALVELGALSIERGQLDEASATFAKVFAVPVPPESELARRREILGARDRSAEILSRAFERAKRWTDVIKTLEIDRAPVHSERLCKAYFYASRFEDAAALGDKILVDEPRNGWANYVLGGVALRNNDRASALLRFEVAYSTRPDEPVFAEAYGRALHAAGRGSQALGVLNKAVQRAPRNADLMIEIAAVRKGLFGVEDARQYLEARFAAELRGADAAEVAKVAQKIKELGGEDAPLAPDYPTARAAADEDPTNARKVAHLARLMISEKGDPRGALERLDQLLTQQPRVADLWTVKAEALEAIGRDDEALDAARSARRFAPEKEARPSWSEARLLLRRGRSREALESAVRGLELDPKYAPLGWIAAEAELDLGRTAEAEQRLEALTAALSAAGSADVDDPKLEVLRGRALLGQGKLEPATVALRRAETKRPKDAEVRRYLGEALLRAERITEGAAKLSGVASDAEAPWSIRRAAAEVLFKNGRPDEAGDAYADLLKGAPADQRLATAERIFAARAASSRPWTALDAVTDLVKSGKAEGTTAFAALTTTLLKAGFAAEAAEAADSARAQGIGGPELTAAAVRAYLVAGAFAKALEAADELRIAPGRPPGEVEAMRGHALFGLGRFVEAAAAADDALKVAKSGERAEALLVRLKSATVPPDPDRVIAALTQIVEAAPTHSAAVEGRRLAVDALVSADRLSDAERIAVGFGAAANARTENAMRLAGLRAALGDLVGAAAALEAASGNAAILSARSLIAAEGGPGAVQPRTFGEFCRKLGEKDFAGAAKAAQDLSYEPATLRALYARIADFAARKPIDASAVGRALARYRFLTDTKAPPGRCEAALRPAVERLNDAAVEFDLLRAAWLLRGGDAKAAAAVAVPLLEQRPRDAVVIYLAGAAAAAVGGGASVQRFLETLPAPAPQSVVRDLAALLAEQGDATGADGVLASVKAPEAATDGLRLQTAAARRDVALVAKLAGAATTDRVPAPHVRLARAWAGLALESTRDVAAAEVSLIAADPRMYDRVDLLLLLDATAQAPNDADFARILEECLRRARFSAVENEAVAAVLRRRPRDLEAAGRMEKRLKLIDAQQNIRRRSMRPLTLR